MRRGKQYYIITFKNKIFNTLYNMIFQLELLTSNLNQNWNYNIMRDSDFISMIINKIIYIIYILAYNRTKRYWHMTDLINTWYDIPALKYTTRTKNQSPVHSWLCHAKGDN